MDEAMFDRLLATFLRQHPAYQVHYQVTQDGDVQIQSPLYNAFVEWMMHKGHITASQAGRLRLVTRVLEERQ